MGWGQTMKVLNTRHLDLMYEEEGSLVNDSKGHILGQPVLVCTGQIRPQATERRQ